ncbi:hypothetical protein KDD17_11540 [Sulfitobacter albidus]|uniref:Thiol:disulfide interchange protein DsbD N-terminal domain-containing protein n=1 Tax=Sulfitobacter albidus TaxID=2829501 RepID=A0A975PLE5_9RHOB|nr:protein-disulfide reductase DsbD domain-containing protein [Sulfitobacter albidus]QUJ75589.1 hypothetical protein KDD17_11540 [Sulfitobacter albidus]
MKRYLKWAALAALSIALPAQAQSIGTSPVEAELIEGWQRPDGTRIGAVRLTLAPGWKTYWRSPGDAGIPPQFNWRGSRNLRSVAVNWPTPMVFDQYGMTSVGYTDQVILPLSVTARRPGQPVQLDLTMDIGVCRDVCIPERVRVKGTLAATGTQPVPAIAAALAERPYTASEAGAGQTTCTLKSTDEGLQITATLRVPNTGGREHVVIEAGRADVWVSEAQVRRSGATLTAQAEMIPNGGSLLSLDRSAVRFTVIGGSHAVDLHGCVAG